jgi:DNA-binding NtrC family response regulator
MNTTGTRVLIVDDDAELVASLARWLELRCGAHVTSFGSAEEVMVAATPSSFDVCLLDYRLNGVNGVTLGAMLREINPDAALVLLSGELSAQIRTSAFEHGFGQVLAKPVEPEMIAEVLSTC